MPDDNRLADIATSLTMLRGMRSEEPAARDEAWRRFVNRYEKAVKSYLGKALGNAYAVDELYADFLHTCVRSLAPRFDPERGRFRAYVKTTLINLVRKRHGRRSGGMPLDEIADPVDQSPGLPDLEATFAQEWKAGVLQRALEGLREHEKVSGRALYSVLRLKMEEPELRSGPAAERISARLGQPVSAPLFRKWLQHARETFGWLVVDEVARTLEDPSRDNVAEELTEMGLWEQCKEAFEKWAPGAAT